MKNVIFTTLMIFAACLGGTKAYMDHRLCIELDNSIESIAEQVTIEYTDANISLLGAIIVSNLRLNAPGYTPVQIDTVTLYKAYQFYNLPILPQMMSIAIQGIHIPINDTTPPTPVLVSAFGYAPYYLNPRELRALGYARVNADVYLETKLHNNKMSVLGTMNAHAWGELRLSADFTNMSTPVSLPKAIKQIRLSTLTLTYTNQKLIDRIFTYLAQRNRMTVDNIKQTLSSKLKNDIRQAPLTLDPTVLLSLQQFIQIPNRLTLRLQPTPPIMINQLFQVSPKRLGLKMTTTS